MGIGKSYYFNHFRTGSPTDPASGIPMKFINRVLLSVPFLFLLSGLLSVQGKESAPYFAEEILFPQQDNFFYRIPTIVVTNQGTVFAAVNARWGTAGDFSHTTLTARRRASSTGIWEPVITIGGDAKTSCCIGSSVYDSAEDQIFLFGGSGVYVSDDDAKTFHLEKFIRIPNAKSGKTGGTHGSGPGIVLSQGKHAGRLLLPARYAYGQETAELQRSGEKFHKFLQEKNYNCAIYSDDHGKTWKTSDPVQIGTGEGTLAELADGRIFYNSRAYFLDGKRRTAISRDGGETFADFSIATDLTEPPMGCNASMIRIPASNGDGLLLYTGPQNTKKRSDLCLMISRDNGAHWKRIFNFTSGCFGAYSALAWSQKDQKVVMIYETNKFNPNIVYGEFVFAEFNLEWIHRMEKFSDKQQTAPKQQTVKPAAKKPQKQQLLETAQIKDVPSIKTNKPQPVKPLVGAIRWDAWYGNIPTQKIKSIPKPLPGEDPSSVPTPNPGKEVLLTLSEKQWEYRWPFFAQTDDKGNLVELNANRQEIMDQEIEYAQRAGLDYWAFAVYPEECPTSFCLKKYLSSSKRSKIDFCFFIVNSAARGRFIDEPEMQEYLLRYISEPGYLKVQGNRPVIFMGFFDDYIIKRYQEGSFWKDYCRKIQAKGLGTPYIVLCGAGCQPNKKMDLLKKMFNADAIGNYAITHSGKSVPYKDLTKSAEAFPIACRQAGLNVVPTAMTGWDRRPRVLHPVSWERWHKKGEGLDLFCQSGSPNEIAAHVKRLYDGLKNHPNKDKVNMLLIYAWNEFDEGGWLAPTKGEGTARIDALGKVLKH